MNYLVSINPQDENSKAVEFTNGKQAVEFVLAANVGAVAPETKRFNPVMVLKGYSNEGLIKLWTKKTGAPTFELHNATDWSKKSTKSETPKTTNKMENANTPAPKTSAKVDKRLAALELLGDLFAPQEAPIDETRINEIVKTAIDNLKPRQIEVKIADLPTKKVGAQHKEFDTLLALLANKMNVWLAGPAGSGKTTAASAAAEAIGVPFYSISVCAQTTKSELFGYNDANGNYVPSLFYNAFKNGGVFLIDEIDSGNANVLSVLNAALENGHCAFPCGMVERNEKFMVVAAANTIGTGGNMQYVGRNRIDAATLNRFFMMDWQYDEALELLISPNETFTKKVQEIRAKAAKMNLSCIISPRVSKDGGRMIAAGMSEAKVLELTLWNKMGDAERGALKEFIK